MRRGRAAAAAAALAACLFNAGCVYTRAEVEEVQPFRFQRLPYPLYDSDDGLSLNLLMGYRRPANRRPPAVVEAVTLDAMIATSRSRGISLSWDRPGVSRTWRFYSLLGAEVLKRAPYFGTGNDAPLLDSLEGGKPPYYRYELLRTTAYGAVQRNISTHVRLHAALQARHYRARRLGDSTLFAADVASGALSDSGSDNGVELRLGVLWDTRDEEATPSRGLFVEGMVARAVAGGHYTRYLAGARVFVPIGEVAEWVFCGRTTVELASGSVPFYVAYERLTTWYLEDGFGGATSLRLQPPGRYVAPSRWVSSIDMRKKVIDVPYPPSPMRLWILGFADVGRLWNRGEPAVFSSLHWSAGAGGRLQIAKGTLLGLDFGTSDAGPSFAMSTSFAF